MFNYVRVRVPYPARGGNIMNILETDKSIWTVVVGSNPAICVTTNGMTKKDGSAVMGRGIARECAVMFPDIPVKLGERIISSGSGVYNFGVHIKEFDGITHRFSILSFPTKTDWRYNSDKDLICRSCVRLVELTDLYEFDRVFLPPPGCGNGGLNWERDVKDLISQYLDDRFAVVLRKAE